MSGGTTGGSSAPARGPGSPRFRRILAVVAALYLAGIWLEVAGAPLQKLVPRPILYFMQVAKLFPHAVPMATEFRAEAYSCADRVYREIDVRPFFPIRANDKENRFERAMFFYRHQPLVMRALDDYIVASADAAGTAVGGVRFLSVRIPIPPPGQMTEPYTRKALHDYPAEYRKAWYQTPGAVRRARCHEEPPPGQEEEKGHGPASP